MVLHRPVELAVLIQAIKTYCKGAPFYNASVLGNWLFADSQFPGVAVRASNFCAFSAGKFVV
jgi:hypothetical protein